jgi:hypothetical protein
MGFVFYNITWLSIRGYYSTQTTDLTRPLLGQMH